MTQKRKGISHSIRREVIDRDSATCQRCGKVGYRRESGGKPIVVEFTTEQAKRDDYPWKAFHFHHRLPVFLGGHEELDNLELRCQRCNSGHGRLKSTYRWQGSH